MKPERAWKVGDRTFTSYEEARAYATNNKRKLASEELADVVRKAIRACPYRQAEENNASDIAELLLKRYTFTKRRSIGGNNND